MKKTCLFIALGLISLGTSFSQESEGKLSKKLQKYVEARIAEFDQIDPERKVALKNIGDYVFGEVKAGNQTRLLFVCTHNSRRSQMAQLWATVAGYYFGISNLGTYSGGTEATAFHPNALAALKRAGFSIAENSVAGSDNPRYYVYFGKHFPAQETFSKKFDDKINPSKDFAAIMVCSEADKSCPIVPGAEARFSLPFLDPRHYDQTPSLVEKYDETCSNIAREIFFMMDYAKRRLISDAELAKE